MACLIAFHSLFFYLQHLGYFNKFIHYLPKLGALSPSYKPILVSLYQANWNGKLLEFNPWRLRSITSSSEILISVSRPICFCIQTIELINVKPSLNLKLLLALSREKAWIEQITLKINESVKQVIYLTSFYTHHHQRGNDFNTRYLLYNTFML